MSDGIENRDDTGDAHAQWQAERTTFQRVYDVTSGITAYKPVSEIAEHAACSTDGARDALKQLVEMGVVKTRGSRPVEYRRNDEYFRWKRVETLASEHTADELRTKIDALASEDASLQDRFNVPDPDVVPPALIEDQSHEAAHETLEALSRWRTLRDDLRVLQRAAHRATQRREDVDSGVSA
jgi:hypothetical protein